MTTNQPQTRAEARAHRQSRAASVLSPAFRRWAYGVSIAALGVAVFAGWLPPAAATVAVPLLMAVFFVSDAGEPRS